MRIFIGTSGWTYADWRGRFYPPKLPQREWLSFYAARFPTVELNVTTYRLPNPADLLRWSAVPAGFRYTIKLSRLITHRRTPGAPQRFVDTFFRAADPLRDRIANVLAQLPPHLERNDDVLRGLIAALPPGYRYVVEFRHTSWYAQEVYRLLHAHGISLFVHDLAGSVTPPEVTGPLLYVRLHGPVRAYSGSYSRARLERWAEVIVDLACRVEETFVYFNNDEHAHAPRNAETLRALIERR